MTAYTEAIAPKPFQLEDYEVSPETGFLPTHSPAEAQLPDIFWQVQLSACYPN
jgi:indoleamine 2,3-dioxygenase